MLNIPTVLCAASTGFVSLSLLLNCSPPLDQVPPERSACPAPTVADTQRLTRVLNGGGSFCRLKGSSISHSDRK